MMLGQERLSAELSRRIRATMRATEQAGSPAQDSVAASDIQTAAAGAPDLAAIVVIRDFNMPAFARASLAFTFELPETWRRLWFSAFTRTIFLAGNPDNLRQRFPFQHIAADGSSAWLGPASPAFSTGLRRLLVTLRAGSATCLPGRFELVAPGASNRAACDPPAGLRVYVATAGLSAVDYLIHLNHALAEAAIMGLIPPGSKIAVRNVPRLHTCPEELTWLRVHRDDGDASRLRAYAGVSRCD